MTPPSPPRHVSGALTPRSRSRSSGSATNSASSSSGQALRDEQAARRTADAELEQRLRTRLDELARNIEAEQERIATAEARGLPLVAAGVAFTAIPDAHLAALPNVLAWVLVLGAFLGLLAYAAWPRRVQAPGAPS